MKIIILMFKTEILQLSISLPSPVEEEFVKVFVRDIEENLSEYKVEINLSPDLTEKERADISKKAKMDFGHDFVNPIVTPAKKDGLDNIKSMKKMIKDMKKLKSPNVIVSDLKLSDKDVTGVVITIT